MNDVCRMRFFVIASTLLIGAGAPAFASPAKITQCGPITASGSYVVDHDLSAAGHCLIVAADFVSINLDGFTLRGNGSGRGIWDGVVAHRGIRVYNGTVTNFQTGIDLGSSVGSVVERVQAVANPGYGIDLGQGSTVADSVARDNGVAGIFVEHDSTVAHNVVTGNGALGSPNDFALGAGDGCRLTDNVVNGNLRRGIVAFLGTGSGGVVSGNTVFGNGGTGISVGAGATVTGNSVRKNDGYGIRMVCPGNAIGNTATQSTNANLLLSGMGCNSSNNVAP
jgi:parallel beta-helix repeat protein